jgi:hypothetical protein
MENVIQLQVVQAQRAQACAERGAETPKACPWEVERDVIRGRTFDRAGKFMPDGLSHAARLGFLRPQERTLFSQIQGRTYANTFKLMERAIGASTLELSRSYVLGDQDTLDALVGCTHDEVKHQALFSRIDLMMAGSMPQGYRYVARANEFAWIVLGRSRWAVLALTHMMELVTQAHYRESIEPDPTLSALYKDVFLFHWRDEERHAGVTEREWRAEDARLTEKERDAAVDDFLELLRNLNIMLQRQAAADAQYFFAAVKRPLAPPDAARVQATFVRAYRWQYVLAGVQHERFADVLAELASDEQGARIAAGLLPLAVPSEAQALVPKGAIAAEAP